MASPNFSGDVTSTVVENSGVDATGDLDHNSQNANSEWNVTIQGEYGSATINDQGEWVYVLDESHPVVDALDDGETLTDLFTVTFYENGDTSTNGNTQQVQITISGVTDPCYAKGSRIRTPKGWVRIENLREGDLVVVEGKHSLPIIWIFDFKSQEGGVGGPICIPKNSFGPNLPMSDLIVSPNHLILLKNFKIDMPVHFKEMFVPAKFLVLPESKALFGTKARPLYKNSDVSGIHYFHFILPEHSVVEAENIWSESLNPGPVSRETLSKNKSFDLNALEKTSALEFSGLSARPIIRKSEWLNLCRMYKNSRAFA